MAAALALLRTPWQLGALQIPHRVVMGSMHTGLEVGDDGEALAAFYRERVAGGAGLVITGGLAVSEIGRGGPDYAVLPEAAHRLAVATHAVHEAGGLIAAQLFHAGRYAVLPEGSVAPSSVPWRAERGIVPRALEAHEVRATIDDFARAASAAHSAGFDAVEIMASEGYLVNQFCSPITNLRDDEWGGDASRRRRFAVELVTAVRAAVPAQVAVLVRMSGNDLMPGSSTPDEVDALARALVDAGVDGISVGVGWHESSVPTVQGSVPHGAWLPESERISAAIGRAVPVIASNRFNDLRDAERALERGTVDAVALARPFLADPTIVARSFAGEFGRVNSCIACNQACIDRSLIFEPVSCLVNPRAGRETVFPLDPPATTRSRIAVVGAGPAGLIAAVDLARRGHAVTLFEAGEPGGQFRLAARIPGKEDYALTVSSALAELDALGATVSFGVTATAAELAGFDGVIVATGVRPRAINIPGADLPHVVSYEHAIEHGVPDGPVAIIGGGGIGVDVASLLVEPHDERSRALEFSARFGLGPTGELARSGSPGLTLAQRPGSEVTILRRSGKFGQGVGISSRWVVLANLRAAGVRMLGGVRYRAITPDGVEVESAEGAELVPARTVIVCAGQVERSALADELRAAGIRHLVVGGARLAGGVDAVRATSEALAAAREITMEPR
jgi:2,4-dienoyl-CoA reductase (NADPH2)